MSSESIPMSRWKMHRFLQLMRWIQGEKIKICSNYFDFLNHISSIQRRIVQWAKTKSKPTVKNHRADNVTMENSNAQTINAFQLHGSVMVL